MNQDRELVQLDLGKKENLNLDGPDCTEFGHEENHISSAMLIVADCRRVDPAA